MIKCLNCNLEHENIKDIETTYNGKGMLHRVFTQMSYL